jgi:2-(1,2-epoxy-1,2-dihydrophenyl)acetyl-CoA isomerase
MSREPVLLSIDDGLAHIRLNRPDAANGMNVELLKALCDALMQCHGARGLRAVLLTGEGKNFCAGGDVRAFAAEGEKLPDYIRVATAYLQNAVAALIRLQAAWGSAVEQLARRSDASSMRTFLGVIPAKRALPRRPG